MNVKWRTVVKMNNLIAMTAVTWLNLRMRCVVRWSVVPKEIRIKKGQRSLYRNRQCDFNNIKVWISICRTISR